MSKPLVSIIIPTYKSGETLRQAIQSVLDQDYRPLELLVVDDNQPGTAERAATEAIMASFAGHPLVTYLQHERNRNGSAARNTGFRQSRGDYLCFLDDDDLFLPGKLTWQVAWLAAHPEHDAVYTWRRQYGGVIGSDKSGDLSADLLTLSFTPYTSSIMLTRRSCSVLNGFDESYRRHQDYEFLLRFFEQFTIGVIPEPLVAIRTNQVDNRLHGKAFRRLKDQFLRQFDSQIRRIEKSRPGFRKQVHAAHYAAVFWDSAVRLHLLTALCVLVNCSLRCGLVFWRCLLRSLRSKIHVRKAAAAQQQQQPDSCSNKEPS